MLRPGPWSRFSGTRATTHDSGSSPDVPSESSTRQSTAQRSWCADSAGTTRAGAVHFGSAGSRPHEAQASRRSVSDQAGRARSMPIAGANGNRASARLGRLTARRLVGEVARVLPVGVHQVEVGADGADHESPWLLKCRRAVVRPPRRDRVEVDWEPRPLRPSRTFGDDREAVRDCVGLRPLPTPRPVPDYISTRPVSRTGGRPVGRG